jgi:acyl-CoA-binding protein
LELYAWHKQAVSGDAPSSMPAPMTAAEKAKYNAWKSKSGTETTEAMRNYISESERQVRVYGYTPTNAAIENSNDNGGSTPRAPLEGGGQGQTSRGLAAIPLLCAAASEQRPAYLRRLQNTPMAAAWWKRQEPLTATPGSVYALPESILLWVASTVEYLSLSVNNNDQVIPGGTFSLPEPVSAMLQSGLWPLHNALLAVWMGFILIASVLTSTVDLSKTLLLGSRRTGRTLAAIWSDDVVFAANSVHTLTESHQPVSARVVGLVLQPLPLIVTLLGGMNTSSNRAALTQAGLFSFMSIVLWWYWLVTLPWFFVVVMLGTATLLGNCFGLIELASHI